jgi:hypothetical protein
MATELLPAFTFTPDEEYVIFSALRFAAKHHTGAFFASALEAADSLLSASEYHSDKDACAFLAQRLVTTIEGKLDRWAVAFETQGDDDFEAAIKALNEAETAYLAELDLEFPGGGNYGQTGKAATPLRKAYAKWTAAKAHYEALTA